MQLPAGAEPSGERSSWLLAVAAAVLLLVPIIINGYPLLYDDTTAYMRRSAGALVVYLGPAFGSEWLDPERTEWLRSSVESAGTVVGSAQAETQPRQWTSGRSVYYGFTIYALALLADLWGPAVFQALIAGILLYLCWFRVLNLRSARLFLLICAVLAVASSLSYFVGLIMPDVFAGFTILASATLLFGWNRLRRAERLVTVGIASFSIMAHDTHLLLAGGLLGTALICVLLQKLSKRSGEVVPAGVIAVAVCLAVGVLGNLAYRQAAIAVTGKPPIRLPHITAHMASLQPSVAYLKDSCPQNHWTVCKHVDDLPMDWIDFMFGHPDVYDRASPDKRRRLSEEQLEIAGSMLRDRPVTTMNLAATEAGRQLFAFSYYDLGQESLLRKDVPPPVQNVIRRTQLVKHPELIDWLSALQQVVVVLGFITVLALTLARRKLRDESAARSLTWFVLAGVAINAVICGVLAYPYDRFQTRVVWLVPTMALFWLAVILSNRRAARPREAEV
jgi:hypothetical protein